MPKMNARIHVCRVINFVTNQKHIKHSIACALHRLQLLRRLSSNTLAKPTTEKK